jgi:hypothetical protein
MSRDSKDLVVGLDIGTSKIVALVAELNAEERLNVIGIGSQESRGLKKGVVVNIEETVATISRVLQEVELMADCKVRDVYTGIAGSHIRSFNSNGMVAIKDKEVTTMDVERVIETARAMPIPADQEILHILTQEFIIDDQDGIREPIGMSGFRLEVKVHIVENLLIGRNRHRPGGFNHPLDVHRGDFLILDGNHAVRVEASDVAAGNSGIHVAYLAVGHQFDFLQNTRNRCHGLLDIDHDALLQTF